MPKETLKKCPKCGGNVVGLREYTFGELKNRKRFVAQCDTPTCVCEFYWYPRRGEEPGRITERK